MASSSETTKKAWEKVMYKHQPYPDNYTDEMFLTEMKKNVNTRMYDLKSVVFESGVVSQQLSTICIFVATFYYLNTEEISPTTLLQILFTVFIVAVCFRRLMGKPGLALSSFIIVCTFVLVLSPVLKTLTKSVSTDTVYAMATGMFMANLLMHDYGAGVRFVSKAISLNTSIFAAVCLSSRLPSFWHVYAFVMQAIVMFALFPEFRADVKNWKRRGYILLTELLALVATLMLIPVSWLSAVCLILAHAMITFAFPLWMVKLQQLKNNIHGPWDEARIK